MLTKKFGHNLTIQPIVLKEQSDADKNESIIANETGYSYPLIRLNDFVFNRKDITSFSYDVGGSILPSFRASVYDSNRNLIEDNKPKLGDAITLFVGNPNDNQHEPIKADFFLTSCQTSTESYLVSGILHIPEMYMSPNRVFEQKSSIEVLEEIAKECKLGFVTNVETTNDRMNWIQYQKTIDFVSYVAEKSYISNDTKLIVFVDQWNNLNVISLKDAITETPTATFVTHPKTGEELETDFPIQLTNKNLEQDTLKLIYDSYNKSDDYGMVLMNLAETLQIETLDINGLQSELIELSSPHKSKLKQIIKSEKYTGFYNDNAYKEYFQSEIRNAYMETILTGIKLNITIENLISSIYLFMSLPNTIYNSFDERKHSQNQDEEIPLETDDSEIVERDKNKLEYNINDELSGDVLVIGMNYSYDGHQPDSRNYIKTNLSLFIKKSNDYYEMNNQNQNT